MHFNAWLLASLVLLMEGLPSKASPVSDGYAVSPRMLAKRKWNNQCLSPPSRKARVESEIAAMSTISSGARDSIRKDSTYFKAWVGDSHQTDEQADSYKKDYYGPVLAFANNEDETATITCQQTAECKKGGGKGASYAYTTWDEKNQQGTINLCDPFFDETNFPSTKAMEDHCGDKDRTVEEFETPAATLLHEFLHLGVCTDIQAPFEASDEKYGSQDCYDLARNDEDKALENADNWMLVTIGTYWDLKCKRKIKTGVKEIDNAGTPTTLSPPNHPPPFPSPSCSPAADGGFDAPTAQKQIGDFCAQTATISPGSQPISKVYDGGNNKNIRFTLSWDNTDNCPASQSPFQNAGRDCNTIFYDIIWGCPNGPSFQNGGSITWNCGYWHLGFDDGGPDVAPPPTPPVESIFPTPT